jgi:hypothetical protein
MSHFFVPIGQGLITKPYKGGVPWMYKFKIPGRDRRKELHEGLRFETREDMDKSGYVGFEVA